MVASDNIKKLNFICPICKSKKDIDLPVSIINQNIQLTTISIPKDMVCKHYFQGFVDKQFRIRGYQKVDYELNKDKTSKLKSNFISSLDLYSSTKNDDEEIKLNKSTNHNIRDKLHSQKEKLMENLERLDA